MEKWEMIVNPKSASARTGDAWKNSVSLLEEAGLEVDAISTEYAGHAIELTMEAAAGGFRKFITAGGDGTLHEVMTGLLRYADENGANLGDFTLAVLPYGTGNDWILTAGVPSDLTEAAKCIIKGNTAKEDVVRVTFSNGVYCLANVGGVGLDAVICYYTNNLKKKGHRGSILYKLVAPYSILSRQRNPVEVVCDGETIYTGRLFSIVIGNGLYRGGGLRQTLDGGVWDDGLLEVSVQGDVNHIKGMMQMAHVFKGDFSVLPGIISRRFRKMTVKPLGEAADYVELDGEVHGTLPITVEVTGQQINIIVP